MKKLVRDLGDEAGAIGYPGLVPHSRPVAEPHNLGRGWAGFDFDAAFRRPAKVMNDAAMQALGSGAGEKMAFLGFGTGLGSALIVDGVIEPTELSHLRYRNSACEDYVGVRGLARLGKKKWRGHVVDVVERLSTTLEPDEIVLGGGNVKKLKTLPPGFRAGDNANAFKGGFRLWQEATRCRASSRASEHGRRAKPPTGTH